MRASRSLGSTIRVALTAALLAATGATVASAERLDQRATLVTPLGAGSSAETYWVDEPEGFRVFTTVRTVLPGAAGQEERPATVRFSTILRPGQTQTIAVPAPHGGAAPSALQIRRLADRVEVKAAAEPAAF